MEFVRPAHPCGTGVLVLAGSSGRVDGQRAQLLARQGALAAPMRWFGGQGQQPGPWEVPIESFIEALDVIAPEVDRLAILGVSYGAEAALVTASVDERVDRVAAFAPTSVVWAGHDEMARRETSKWTYRQQPVPYLRVFPATGHRADGPPSYLATYERSLALADPAELRRATIRTEQIAHLLLVSGGDDRVWPSVTFARAITDQRAEAGLTTEHVTLAGAGHRTLLPGERAPTGGRAMLRGGTPQTDAALGRLAWPRLRDLLALHPPAGED